MEVFRNSGYFYLFSRARDTALNLRMHLPIFCLFLLVYLQI